MRHHADYEPARLGVPARHAGYTANLLILSVIVQQQVRISELYGDRIPDPIERWNTEALLWRSQLSVTDWPNLVETFTVHRIREHGDRDLVIALDDGNFVPAAIDPAWTWNLDVAPTPAAIRDDSLNGWPRMVHFMCSTRDDILCHATEPLMSNLNQEMLTFFARRDSSFQSVAHALINLWLRPQEGPPQARAMVAAAWKLTDDEVLLESWLRFAEMGQEQLPGGRFDDPELFRERLDLEALARTRPDLIRRARWVCAERYPTLRIAWPDLPKLSPQ